MAVVAVTRERRAGETRVALNADAVKRLVGLGLSVVVESGSGLQASVSDNDYVAAGARVARTLTGALGGADILVKVRGPETKEIAALKSGAIVVGLLNPHQERAGLEAMAKRGLTVFAMEFVPRIS